VAAEVTRLLTSKVLEAVPPLAMGKGLATTDKLPELDRTMPVPRVPMVVEPLFKTWNKVEPVEEVMLIRGEEMLAAEVVPWMVR